MKIKKYYTTQGRHKVRIVSLPCVHLLHEVTINSNKVKLPCCRACGDCQLCYGGNPPIKNFLIGVIYRSSRIYSILNINVPIFRLLQDHVLSKNNTCCNGGPIWSHDVTIDFDDEIVEFFLNDFLDISEETLIPEDQAERLLELTEPILPLTLAQELNVLKSKQPCLQCEKSYGV